MQNDSALKTRIHNLSDEELVEMIKKASEYQPEAIEYAQEELSSRGGLDAISDRISISQQHEEEIVKQYETKAPLPLATKPPWDPRSFIVMAIFFSFAASGILAGLNWRRLGKPQWMWSTILLSVGGFVGLVALDLLLGSESQTTGGAYLINIGLGGLMSYLQKPAYKEWVATYGKPTTKQSGWLIPIGICLGTIAVVVLVVVLIAFGPMFLQTYRAIEHFNRGVEYQQQGQLKLTIEEYTQAIDLDPQLVEAYNNRGIAYVEKGQHDQAISDYTKAIEIDPGYVDAYYNRGLAYKKKGQYDQAISDFNKAMEIDPEYAMRYYNRGFAYYEKGQYEKAISDFTKAMEIDPEYAMVYNSFAWILATCPDAEYRNGVKAVELAQKAVELDPEDIWFWFDTLAAAYAEAGRFEDAITTQEKAIALLEKEGKTEEWAAEYVERLDSYKAHKPWRER